MAVKSLFVLGDSISIQYGTYLEKMLRGVLDCDRKKGKELAMRDLDVPEGANGGDSFMVLRYLEARFADGCFKPDILMLNCGLHDIKTNPSTSNKQVTPQEYEHNLIKITTLLTQHDISTIWVRTTPFLDEVHNSRSRGFHRYTMDLEMYNTIADEIMRRACIPGIDLYTFTKNLGDDIYCDHVHFNENIRELQAAFIAGNLMSIINCDIRGAL